MNLGSQGISLQLRAIRTLHAVELLKQVYKVYFFPYIIQILCYVYDYQNDNENHLNLNKTVNKNRMVEDQMILTPEPNRKRIGEQLEQSGSGSAYKTSFNRHSDIKMKTEDRKTERYLQNFILGQKIGVGTFSKVCVAKHRITNQNVAIKIIDKSKIQNQADQNRLNREIKIMRKVRHPNIIQLYEIIETVKYIYLITEYAARGQLFDHIISQEKLTQLEASRFLLQLVDAISYIHEIGVAHRDLKPQNLLLDYKFNMKVIDFGLSNIYAKNTQLTTACGSPCYACPEMISSRSYDGLKADIWSIGIILYAMCFGYLPFENENTSVLYDSIKKGQFEIPECASNSLIHLLKRILCVNPEERATIKQIRSHDFCKLTVPSLESSLGRSMGIIISLSDIPFEPQIQEQMKTQFKVNTNNLKLKIKNNKHNEETCMYYLILQRKLRQKNQSLLNYYSKKFNQINRYAIIENVKANFDRKLIQKKQFKNFGIIQQNKTHHKSTMSPKTISRAFKTIQKYKDLRRVPVDCLTSKKQKQKNNFKSDRKYISKKSNHHDKHPKSVSSKNKRRNRSLPKSLKLQF